jgi:pimeloyl-ACP methyl ester carboxylesterase
MSVFSDRFCKPRVVVFGNSILGLTVVAVAFSLGLVAREGLAQPAPAGPAAPAGPPPPEDIKLMTDDGLALMITYFPGTNAEESIPVVLLHGAKGNRKDFTEENGLAPLLQEKLGCAVIVPDLRGHGESTQITIGSRTEKLEAAKLRPAQYTAMVSQDMRAVKSFLWKKNNAKALNIDKLAVIGVDMGAAVALNFAADDSQGYEQGTPIVGKGDAAVKLGQFVKAVVFISPSTDISGLSLPPLMRQSPEIFQRLSVMTLAGNKDRTKFAQAKTLNNLFEKARKPETEAKIGDKTVFFLSKIETQLQSTKLLDEPTLKIPDKIVYFLNLRLVKNPKAKDEWVWKERKLPHE